MVTVHPQGARRAGRRLLKVLRVVSAGALMLVASMLPACGDPEEPNPAASPTPHSGGVHGQPTASDAPTCGWLPAAAREATPRASLHGRRDGDPLCSEAGSVLDRPKAVVAAIERKLREATQMSDADEAAIGARVEAALSREPSFIGKLDRPEDVRRYGPYLRDIVQNLATKTTRPRVPYRIHLVHLPVFNAAALPGGILVVFTGTLAGPGAVRDEAELAGVLGHEMTHVERRHVVAAYQFARATVGEDTDEAVLVMRLLAQPLSTEYELEADDRGMEIATLAGYDPQAVVNLWRRKAHAEQRAPQGEAEEGDVVTDLLEGVDALLRSHPPPAVRACRAMDKVNWARAHAPCDRVYDGRTNLRTLVAGPRRAY